MHELGPFGKHLEEGFERLNNGLLNSPSVVPLGGVPFSLVCQPELQALLACGRKILSVMQSMRFSIGSPLEHEVLLAVMPGDDKGHGIQQRTMQFTQLYLLERSPAPPSTV
jgi:hypothetical protein